MQDFGGSSRERRGATRTFAPIPSGTADFTALPQRERLDAMRKALRPFYEVGAEPASDVVCKWTIWNLDQLLFSKACFSSLVFEHAPRRLKGVDHECLLVETYLGGSGDGIAGDRLLRLRPGSIQITDLSRHFVNATTAVSTYGVLIPHAAVGYDPSRHPPSLSLPSHTPHGRVLFDALLAQFHQLDYVAVEEAPRLAHRFAALVSELAFSPDKASEFAGRHPRPTSCHRQFHRDPDRLSRFPGARYLCRLSHVARQPLSPFSGARRHRTLHPHAPDRARGPRTGHAAGCTWPDFRDGRALGLQRCGPSSSLGQAPVRAIPLRTGRIAGSLCRTGGPCPYAEQLVPANFLKRQV